MAAHLNLGDFFQPFEIWRHHRRMERLQWEPPDRVRAERDLLLGRVLRHAAAQVPRYQSVRLRYGGTAADLELFPFLTKADARADRAALIADDARRYSPRAVVTSGTTGLPFEVLLDRASFAMEFAHYWRHWSWAGYRLGDRFAEFSTAHFVDRPAQEFIHQRAAGRLILNAAFLDRARVRAHAERIRLHRVRFIKSAPSTLAAFCGLCSDLGISIDGVRAVFLQGETLRPDQRQTVERFFNCKVYNSYGQMERVAAIAECPAGRLHALEDYGYVEWTRETESRLIDEPAPDRTAEVYPARIIATSLHNFAMPLIRYETGDRVWLDAVPAPCPCGRSFRTVRRVDGRSEDVLVTPDGRVLAAAYLSLCGIPGVRSFAIVQDQPDHAGVELWIPEGISDEAAAAALRTARERLTSMAGPSMRLTLDRVKEAEGRLLRTGSKFRTVVNLIR